MLTKQAIISIFLVFTLFVTAQRSPSTLYGALLEPAYFKLYEQKDFRQSLTSINFPVVKIDLTRNKRTPSVCEIVPSVPDFQKISTLFLKPQVSLSQAVSINNFLYLVYNDLTVDLFQTSQSEISQVASFPAISHNSLPLQVAFSKALKKFKILTEDYHFNFDWDQNNGNLTFINKLDVKSNSWIKYQSYDKFLYTILEDHPNSIFKLPTFENDLSHKTQVTRDFAQSILDFYVTETFIFIIEAGKGVYVFQNDETTTLPPQAQFIQEPNSLKVIGNDHLMLIVKEKKNITFDGFEVLEFIKTQNGYLQNSIKSFSGVFTGNLSFDDTKVFLLNQNVMFAWFHSMPQSIQDGQPMSSFVFYGETNLQKIQDLDTTLIFTQTNNQLVFYRTFDKYPEIFCQLKSIQKADVNRFDYHLAYTGTNCPLKAQHHDSSLESLCLYRQEITIYLTSEFFGENSISLTVILAIALVIISLIAVILLHYLLKHKSNSSFFRYKLKDLIDRIRNIDPAEPASPQILKDFSCELENLAIFTEDGVEAEKIGPEMYADVPDNHLDQIIPPSDDEIMKSTFLPLRPLGSDMEDIISQTNRDPNISNLPLSLTSRNKETAPLTIEETTI